MVSTHVVKLVAEYLDGCSADGKQATLVDLCFFVDAKDRTLPSLEEIDAALGQRPNVRVNRIDGGIVFAPSGTNQTLTREDVSRAYSQYHKEFRAALRKLERER